MMRRRSGPARIRSIPAQSSDSNKSFVEKSTRPSRFLLEPFAPDCVAWVTQECEMRGARRMTAQRLLEFLSRPNSTLVLAHN